MRTATALRRAAQRGTQEAAERLPVQLRRGGAGRLGQRLLDADGHQSPVSGSGISSASSIRVEARSSSPLSILPPFRVHSACACESRRMRRDEPLRGRAHLDQLAVPAADVEHHRAVVVALRVRPLHLRATRRRRCRPRPTRRGSSPPRSGPARRPARTPPCRAARENASVFSSSRASSGPITGDHAPRMSPSLKIVIGVRSTRSARSRSIAADRGSPSRLAELVADRHPRTLEA